MRMGCYDSQSDFEHVTSLASVKIYEAGSEIFKSLLSEVKDLSRKKPEATISPGKVKIINRVLDDLLIILKPEPSGKYLEVLDDSTLPQMSDAVLIMVQFEAALTDFKSRYFKYLSDVEEHTWITTEYLASE
jgi:hypothetical protein